jgi:hypothetical protein
MPFSQIHGIFNDDKVIRYAKGIGVYRFLKNPTIFMKLLTFEHISEP